MQFEQTTLPNGLLVMTSASPHLESATIGAFVNVGSRNETEANNGIAHFTEHLMFKGTSNRSALDIATEIEILGSDMNAFTSMDMTAYHVTGLARHVDETVGIIGDTLTNSLFADDEVALESGVIIQEVNRSADSPNSVMYDALQAVSYPDQPFGRTILGSTEFITTAKHDDFQKFTQSHYTADNMVVVGAGGINHDAFVRSVETAFAGLPVGLPAAVPAPARYAGGCHIDRSRDFKQVTAGIAFDAVSLHDATMYHHVLLADVFGGGMSSPLFTEIREKRGLVYSTGCYASLGTDNGRIIISGGMTAENVKEFVSVACAEFRKLCDTVSENDLRRAKNSNLVSLATLREKPYSTACFIARSYWQRGYVRDLAEMREQIEAVTLDDIRQAAQKVLSTVPSIGLIGPVPQAEYEAIVRHAVA